MMTVVVMSLALFGCLWGQASLPAVPLLAYAKPPLLLALTVYYALNHPPPAALGAAVAAGFLQDAYDGVPLGYSALVFCAVAAGINTFRGTLLSEAPVTQIFFGSAGAAFMTAALYGLLVKDGLLHISPTMLGLKIIGTTLLATVSTPPVCAGIAALDRFAGNIMSNDVNVEAHGLGQTLG